MSKKSHLALSATGLGEFGYTEGKALFIVHLKAAKQIGLTIAPNVLARADRAIR